MPWTTAAALVLSGVAVAQTPGPNRNVVSGVVRPLNPDDRSAVIKADIFRQRQNEPVLAPSSTDAEHLLAAANDYRTIDIAGDIGTGESNDSFVSRAFARLASFVARFFGREPAAPARPVAAAEAWMGVYRSCDRGRTWFGSLLPGSPTDSSASSLASPLRGFQAASDPVLAPAPDGRAFLGGLAFTRGTTSAIFVARYTDRNDREGGACFTYDFTRVVEAGTVSDTGRFADKPTIAADVARPHAGPSKRYVYMAYTIFTGNETEKNFRGRVRFVRSEDDGVTWTGPVTISGNFIHNQGAAIAIDPVDGRVYIVWRDFIDDQILMTRSHDFGMTWADPVPIHPGLIAAFDPATEPDQFRSNGFPTIAIDGSSRVFVAWQERVNSLGEPDLAGSSRIVLTMSESITNQGVTWTPRRAVDPGRIGPQVMPALSASAGQLMLVYAEAEGDSFVGRDVRVDVRIAELSPTSGLVRRPSVRVSEYALQANDIDPPGLVETAPGFPAWHRPNLPMFRRGAVPFIGDYKFLAPAQPYVRAADGGWKWASAPGDVGAPSFHAVWTDNRNVQFPPSLQFPDGDINGDWTEYAPPGGGRLSCINPGSRDQDVFTSEISNGIVAGTPSLYKPLLRPTGEPIQRAFVVYVENRTADSKHVVLNLVSDGPDTTVSFDQADPTQTTLPPENDPDYDTMELFPHSTLTRTVYLDNAARADGSARVEVREGQVGGPLLARAVVNESPSPFPLTNTIISDSEIHTPRISNPRISNPRISNPRISNPRISNWTPSNPRISNPRISNPRISNDFLGDGWETRDVTYAVTNVGNTTTAYNLQTFIPPEYFENRNFAFQLIIFKTVSSVGTTGPPVSPCAPVEILHDEFISSVESPRISNPRISNPRISNPRISNAAFYLEPAEGPRGPGQAASDAALSTTSSSRGATTSAAASATTADTGDTSAPLPTPQVYWTMRIFQLAAPAPGEPTIDDIAPMDPTRSPLISAAIVSQSTNVMNGVPQGDPPYALVGPQPPEPGGEEDGGVVPFDNPPAPPSALAFSAQPRDTQAGQTIAPPVEVRVVDASGVTVPVTGVAVTLALGAGSGTLSGTRTQLTDSGFATFGDLSIAEAGTGYTLVASAPGFASAISVAFDTTVGRPLVPPLTTRVSVSSSNRQGTGPAAGCAGGRITPDGHSVAFDCTFTNLATGDPDPLRDVFVRDLRTGTTTLVSVATGGAPKGNKDSFFASLSDDGRYVAFQSSATNLAPGDTNGVDDIFVRDLETGGTRRVSVGLSGVQANGASSLPVISGNGWFVAFWSRATNLVAGDTNGQPDVFVVDLASPNLTTVRVSVQTGGGQTTQTEGSVLPAAPAISFDGRFVAFQSTRSNLAPQGVAGLRDIYVHDRLTLTTTRVSVASDGKHGALPSGCGPWDSAQGKIACAGFAASNPSMSADGRFVAFDSLYSNLVAGDTNYTGPQLGRDVFVYDRVTGQPTRASVSSGGAQDNTVSLKTSPCGVGPSAPMLSPDGRFVSFSSCGSSLVAGDTNGMQDVFLHDRLLKTTVRSSVVSGGTQVTTTSGASGAGFSSPSAGAVIVAMSSDAETMVTGDTNRNVTAGRLGTDIFVHEPIPAPAPPGSRVLAFSAQPGNAFAGEPLSPAIRVELRDAFGNTDLSATDLVTLSVESGPGALQGMTTVSAIGGVATFPTVVLADDGDYTLRASASGLPDALSTLIAAEAAVPAQLTLVTQPTSTHATETMAAIRVAIQSARGYTVRGNADPVTLALTGVGAGLLSGTATVNAVDGIATFDDLSVDVVATGYTLVATALGFTATSNDFDVLPSAAPLAFTVTNTNDQGLGSLRQALLAGNANVGNRDSITFSIDTAGPHTITPSTPLPSVTDPVVLDAATQPGYAGVPLVRLDGGGAGTGANGLLVQGASVSIRGLAITRFSVGLKLDHVTGAVVEDCYVGTDGMTDLGNLSDGVVIDYGSGNEVRHSVISGNNGSGITLSRTSGNRVRGNLIGTNADGSAALPNASAGLYMHTNAFDNTIGGPSPEDRNVVSGNAEGVSLISGAHHNTIEGNRVGTNRDGTAAIGNTGAHGIGIYNDDNVVRGNLISGNTVSGLRLDIGHRTLVEANYIGTNATGTAAIPNGWGVTYSSFGSAYHRVSGNLVSGNTQSGISLMNADHFTIVGNKIGTTVDGTGALPNGVGLEVSGCISTQIGGPRAAANLISGNAGHGIYVSTKPGAVAPYGLVDCVIEGNLVGTTGTGATALGNGGSGLRVSAASAPGAPMSGIDIRGNLLSANAGDGLTIDEGVHHLTASINKIGTDASGLMALGNQFSGVSVAGGSHDIAIQGNLVSGNLRYGIDIRGLDYSNPTHDVSLTGNTIGTNAEGTAAVANRHGGVSVGALGQQAALITIGGTGPEARNLISGNGGDGIGLEDASSVVIQGNRIGTNAAGTSAIRNEGSGVGASDTSGLTVGGIAAGAGNLISGNQYSGVSMVHNTHGVLIAGNRIGTDEDGAFAVANGSGISFGSTGAGVTGVDVGGADPLARNLVSGNSGEGIDVWGVVSGIRIKGNYIGTNAAGAFALPNNGGLRLRGAGVTVGGMNMGEGNLVSGNASYGIKIESGASYIAGNRIGTNAASAGALPNIGPGVKLLGSAYASIIGGLSAGEGNTIAFNTGSGVEDVAGTSGTQILGNSIFSNGDVGIFPNGRQNSPMLASANTSGGATTVSGSLLDAPNSFFRIEYFWSSHCDASGSGEGELLMGRREVTTDGSGSAPFGVTFAAISGGVITATATSPSVGTSGFSACLVPDLASVVADLRTIVSAEAAYQTYASGWYGTMDCLATPFACIPGYSGPAFISTDLASLATRAGYVRGFSAGPEALPSPPGGLQGWAYTAVPESGFGPGYCASNAGIFVNHDGTATAVDGQCTSGTSLP